MFNCLCQKRTASIFAVLNVCLSMVVDLMVAILEANQLGRHVHASTYPGQVKPIKARGLGTCGLQIAQWILYGNELVQRSRGACAMDQLSACNGRGSLWDLL